MWPVWAARGCSADTPARGAPGSALAGVRDGGTHEGEAIAVAVLLVRRLGERVNGPELDQLRRLVRRRALIVVHHDYLPSLRLIREQCKGFRCGCLLSDGVVNAASTGLCCPVCRTPVRCSS